MENKEIKKDVQANSFNEPISEAGLQEQHFDTTLPAEFADAEAEDIENFNSLSKEGIVKTIEDFLLDQNYNNIRSKIIPLREAFNELCSQEKQNLLEKYIENGGEREEFEYKPDELEARFNIALKKVNRKRNEFLGEQEKHREQNLATKKEILVQLKELIQNEENMAKAFNTFHELQAKWRAAGPVPPKNANDLWQTFKLYIKKFYDLIKINRELQELDQRKNLEMKLHTCEQLEDLSLEPSLNKALSKLNILQNRWKEIGHIPRDKRIEIGERYKAAGDKIILRKKNYLEQLKHKQEESLKLKAELCEKAEQISIDDNPTLHEVQEKAQQVSDLQTAWRKTGYTERTISEHVWKRFKTACDNFYIQKQQFYNKRKKEHQANLQLKSELCIQAESLINNTDWKKTSAELRRLNEEWKKIGPVGIKMSNKIWYRFKKACDTFHQNRKSHFSGIDKQHEENYQKKLQLLERIEQFKPTKNKEENLSVLKNFQREWTEIGLVQFEKKDELFARYKKLIDELFDGLRLNEKEKDELRYRKNTSSTKSSSVPRDKGFDEKRNVANKISQLINDVSLWENNLGFFAKSKNADQIKQEFELKIKTAKEEIAKLKEQQEKIKSF